MDKYTWVSQGSSFLLADILSALALAQLRKLSKITELRGEIAAFYLKVFSDYCDRLILPQIDQERRTNWHTFAIRLRDSSVRDFVLGDLRGQGIGASFHYVPLHLSPMGQRLGYKEGDFPLSEKVADSLIRLPIFPHMTWLESERVVEETKKALDKYSRGR